MKLVRLAFKYTFYKSRSGISIIWVKKHASMDHVSLDKRHEQLFATFSLVVYQSGDRNEHSSKQQEQQALWLEQNRAQN